MCVGNTEQIPKAEVERAGRVSTVCTRPSPGHNQSDLVSIEISGALSLGKDQAGRR